MVATRKRVGLSGFVSVTEALGVNAFGEATLVAGACRLQVYGGAAATTITIQRHPVLDNLGRAAPANNDPQWVNVQAPAAVDASGNVLIDFTEPCGFIQIKADKVCTYTLTATDPNAEQ